MRILRRGLARFCPHGRLDKMRFARAVGRINGRKRLRAAIPAGLQRGFFQRDLPHCGRVFALALQGGYAGVSLDAAEKARFIVSPKWRGGKFKLFARGETRGYMNIEYAAYPVCETRAACRRPILSDCAAA